MEVDLVQQNHNGKCVKKTFPKKLRPPDSLYVSHVFGDPLAFPRVGDEYQAEIPPLLTESESRLPLKSPADTEVISNVSHSFLMGLPIPVVWVDDELNNHNNKGPNHGESIKKNGTWGSKNSKKSQIISNKRDLRGKVVSSNVGRCLVPGLSAADPWSDIEVESLILGLYFFDKNVAMMRKFIESKEIGEILSFYYGKFYGSDEHRRWTVCRKVSSKKNFLGFKFFSGWRHQELLSRLCAHVSEERQIILTEASKAFSEGRTSLEGYVSILKTNAGIENLIKAVGIGKGKEDLTTIELDQIKTNQVFPVPPEVPIGTACSSLTSGDIIKFLTGDFCLSKARANDLFWEAVWPRLLAIGWHSEQPKNRVVFGSKNSLIFLIPGIGKFSRRQHVKGEHYFDSVRDVLNKVAAEPKLLEVEAEELETTQDQDDPSDRRKNCYLKPRISTSNPHLMKFTVVDTSSISIVRELRSLPAETKNISELSTLPKDTEAESKDSVENTNSSNYEKGVLDNCNSNQMVQINGSKSAEKLMENCHNEDTNTCDDEQLRRTIKHQFSQVKRRKLSACAKKCDTVGSEFKELGGPSCVLNSPDPGKNLVSPVDPQKKVPPISSFAEGKSTEKGSGTLHGRSGCRPMSSDEIEKPPNWSLIDLNLPYIPSDSENGDFCTMEGKPNGNVSCFPSDTNKLVEDSGVLITSVDDKVSEQQPNVQPRRQSTRNRPLTTRALEALASGFLSPRRRRKGAESQTQENPTSGPSRRSRSRVGVNSQSGSTNTAIFESKKENGMDGVSDGNMNMLRESPAETRKSAAQELEGISKSANPPNLNFKRD